MGQLTPRETEIMQVLWNRGPSTVAEVQAWLNDGAAYTTILTQLRILEEKGAVSRELEGRAHRYAAAIPSETATAGAVTRFVQQFFGSREALLTHLVAQEKLSKKTLQRLRMLVDERLGEERP